MKHYKTFDFVIPTMIKLSCVIIEIITKTTICILLILIYTHEYTFVLHSIEIEQFYLKFD